MGRGSPDRAPDDGLPLGYAQTGIGGEFRASHDDPRGEIGRHWHSYLVEAWFPSGADARDRQAEIERLLKRIDGTHLEDEYAWGERLAAQIGIAMPECVEVVIRREHERIYARWRSE
jgi:hypothetical protein